MVDTFGVTPLERLSSEVEAVVNPFLIDAKNRSYKHQYSNIYFTRLHQLKPHVQQAAEAKWKDIADSPVLVPRLLEVVKGRVCFIIGTVYMDMPLKPNVLEDLGRDRSIPPPAPRPKFYSDNDGIMLEDESGRIPLVGDRLDNETLVTGVIMAALGMENSNGEFQVIDLCFPGFSPNEHTATTSQMLTENSSTDEWVALVSGLDIGSDNGNDEGLQLLSEYFSGELVNSSDEECVSNITRVILAGNSLVAVNLASVDNTIESPGKRARRHTKERAALSKLPVDILSEHIFDIASSVPLHVLPGWTDPTGTILPQQALPRAMLGPASGLTTFHSETNPAIIRITTESRGTPRLRDLLVTSGQTVNDMFKYVETPPTSRLDLAEASLRWRHLAPTAPDTLWCHPYFTTDPFVIEKTPDIYVVGNQDEFSTKMLSSVANNGDLVRCRVILVPRFSQTGAVVLVNLVTLNVKIVELVVPKVEHSIL